MLNNRPVNIIVDYGEERSGIPEALVQAGCHVEMQRLRAGDYLISNQFLVERKTNTDFVQTLMANRLFTQCSKLKNSPYIPSLLIEENPYKTAHNISREAIRGALLAVTIAWQIPINYSSGMHDSVSMLLLIARQYAKSYDVTCRKGYKPKTFKRQQIFFLQGLPMVGPHLAADLLKYFGTVQLLLQATETDLLKVPGIGVKRARSIREFLMG